MASLLRGFFRCRLYLLADPSKVETLRYETFFTDGVGLMGICVLGSSNPA